ncbi:GNAT family N-acetyltransferase [Bacillus sp. FJAT-44742]|uniref:GNAT family N-acetyltransferase n=1 Tax=Bacillus sp. FJAT-44742 TaxID=2014005 RepID=UPI000C247FC9|nr:GNAT family N-acetyltransferase [Bacillus sp. FJAT-44742]
MFIKYKSSYKKIAMGLLSFMPEEKEVKKLQETIRLYEEEENRQLYLWKENDDLVGVIGIYMHEDGTPELKHLCVNPSFRDEGIGRKMVSVLSQRLGCEMVGSEETSGFLSCCENEVNQEVN